MVQIGVIGSGLDINKEVWDIAYEIGYEIAKKDAILICGGKGGVMEAACKGCHDAGGVSVGILPSINKEEANPYVKIKIPTNLGENRNYIVVQSSDALICIAGAVGTRMEANYSLKLNKILVTIPITGGVSKEFSEKYGNKKDYRVYIANNSKEAINIAFEKISEFNI